MKNIRRSLVADAPIDGAKYVTLSFFSCDKYKLANLDVDGFKIHNGFLDNKTAEEEMKLMRKNDKNCEVFLGAIGGLLSWDNVDTSEMLDYGEEKLNDMELKFRENKEKLKMNLEQHKHDSKVKDRRSIIKERMDKKIHARGLLTAEEITKEEQKHELRLKQKNSKDALPLAQIEKEMKDITEDYLKVNDPCPYEYAVVSIFDPLVIKGLDDKIIKIRGIYENIDLAKERAKVLINKYKHDNIGIAPVGVWIPYSITVTNDEELLKRLNYGIKKQLDMFEEDSAMFKQRKEAMIEESKKEQEIKKQHLNDDNTPALVEEKEKVISNTGVEFIHKKEIKDKVLSLADYLSEDVSTKYDGSALRKELQP